MTEEVEHRPEARVAVLGAYGAGIDDDLVGLAQRDRLVEACPVVVEEGDGAGQPIPPGIVAFFQLRKTVQRWEEEGREGRPAPVTRPDPEAASI